MELASNDTFCSLDMLAEVASATLQNDPSLSCNMDARKANGNNSKINIVSPSRKNLNNSEKLTLDQIRVLSDKLLIENFSELICDEIRKNYSFKCFLIPEKCTQIFKSFGSEARARCKMKTHLQSHINDLVSEENGSACNIFTAEPLHIRRKRLKELNTKSVRKRKRSRQQNTKRKKDTSSIDILHSDNDFNSRSRKIIFPNAFKNSKNSLNCEFETCTTTNLDQNIDYVTSDHLPSYHEISINSVQNINLNSYYEDRTSNLITPSANLRQKLHAGRKTKRKNVCSNSTSGNYVVKWNVDFDEVSLDNSSFFDFDTGQADSDPYLPSHHDHTYTSVHGKTYYDVPSGDCNKTVSKTFKDAKNSHHCTDSDDPLVIPTPPFPYVYVPLLPHIAEIKEIGDISKPTSSKCSNDYMDGFHENLILCNRPLKKSRKKDLQYFDLADFSTCEDIEPIIEDDENSASDSFLDDVISDNETYIEASDSGILNSAFNVDDVLETDCPENLQSVEKKLALKCIRALRTKKKDERGPLVCQICKNKSFTAQATLMYHYRSHAGIKPFSCTVCDATFTRQHSLNYHMLIHNNKSRFVCSDCGRNFRHPSHYKEHLRRHTGETPYECTDCNLRFKTRNTYKRHLKTRHGKILSAQGVHVLTVEEFYKVRTIPRQKIHKPSLGRTNDRDTQWPRILFSQRDCYM